MSGALHWPALIIARPGEGYAEVTKVALLRGISHRIFCRISAILLVRDVSSISSSIGSGVTRG
jgi:hypothetical protein